MEEYLKKENILNDDGTLNDININQDETSSSYSSSSSSSFSSFHFFDRREIELSINS